MFWPLPQHSFWWWMNSVGAGSSMLHSALEIQCDHSAPKANIIPSEYSAASYNLYIPTSHAMKS